MSLDYYIISQTTGDLNSSSQILTQNTLAYENRLSFGEIFSFEYPVYKIQGATFDYYGKDYNSISYDISNGKVYTLNFYKNTESVSGTTAGTNLMRQNLYRLKYDKYLQYIKNFETGEANADLIREDIDPLLSITTPCSALTIINSAFTYSFSPKFKPANSFTEDIFFDKGQYLIDTVILFEKNNDLTLGDAYYISSAATFEGRPSPVRLFLEPSATTYFSSNRGPFLITGDTFFTGRTINGAFFTYFVPPKKPDLNVSGGRQRIAVQGETTNLSPTFNFANVDDGDLYQLQVNYDITDTPFSGSNIFTYDINRQAGDAEFVRTFSTPLRSNAQFNYRIGNIKQITNVFGVKQSITTWSDAIYAKIISTGNYVLSGYTWKNYISNQFSGYYHISGMTIGSNASNSQYTYEFYTNNIIGMPLDSISASTSGSSNVLTVNIDYNGTLYTQDWRNAIYSATNFSNLGIYILNESPNTAITSSNFTFTTQSQVLPLVGLNLTNIYNSTNLNLSIDLKSSDTVATPIVSGYSESIGGIQYNIVSDANGFFNFGEIPGGYYKLTAIPTLPQYSAYEPIILNITLNSNTFLDLIFAIIWGNVQFQFEDLTNETFL